MRAHHYFFVFFCLLIASTTVTAQQTEKIFYDKNWKATRNVASAEYYRIITLDKDGRPVGKVKDYYITGELQWEGTLSNFDRSNDDNNIQQGLCTWYFKNGRKSAEATFIDGKLSGTSKEWYESGVLKEEMVFSNDKANGKRVVFYENGKVKTVAEYLSGKLAGNRFIECDEFDKCERVYSETFDSPDKSSDWTLGGNTVIVPDKGLFVNSDKKAGLLSTTHLPIDILKDFSIETIIRFTGGDTNSGNGLIYGFRNWDNYHYFQISPNGFYQIGSVVDGLKLEFVEWTSSKYINQDVNRNLIKITKLGNKVFFSINRNIIHSMDFLRFSGNQIGFYTMAGNKLLYYENLEVRESIEVPGVSPSESTASAWKSSGSGIIIDTRGYIATNYHVVEDATVIEVGVVRNGQKYSYLAKVVVSDKQNDLSILRIEDSQFRSFSSLPYGFATSTADTGTSVFALGFPAIRLLGDDVKLTDGKISSKTGFQGDITTYQISAAVQPGSSGGPLFDYEGNLVGIVSSKVPILENVSYAIKISYLASLIDTLPTKLNISRQNFIAGKPLTEKVKMISDYVVLLKVR